jgi:hypothetical protein
MENALMEGQWLGHAEGLPHGFWVGVQPILPNFSQTTAKKSTPTDPICHRIGISYPIHQTLFVGSMDGKCLDGGTMAGACRGFALVIKLSYHNTSTLTLTTCGSTYVLQLLCKS